MEKPMFTLHLLCPVCSDHMIQAEGLYGPLTECGGCGHRDAQPVLRIPRKFGQPLPARLIRAGSVRAGLRRAA